VAAVTPDATGGYACPLCDGQAPPWHLYPALGRPICDECDAALLDDDATLAAACHIFTVTPSLLSQIIERQRPLLLSPAEVERRFG
jgi:hypothetical protein